MAWIHDLRCGARSLVKRPGFSTVVILTLALGIGANTAVFSVVDAVLLSPLPYPDPERLVRVWGAYPSEAKTRARPRHTTSTTGAIKTTCSRRWVGFLSFAPADTF